MTTIDNTLLKASLNEPQRLETLLPWLIGFTSTIDTVAIGFIGKTPISLSPIVAILYLLCKLTIERGRTIIKLPKMTIFLSIYISYAIISVVILYFLNISEHATYYFKGILILFSYLLIYFALCIDQSEKKLNYALKGFMFGVMINAVYAIYEFFGSYFHFSMIIIGNVKRNADINLLHRAMGFFREPSYLAALLVPAFFLSLSLTKRTWLASTLLIIFSLALTISSGTIVLFIGIVLCFFVESIRFLSVGRDNDPKHKRFFLALIFGSIIVISLLYTVPQLTSSISKVVVNAGPYAQGNEERFETIRRSLALALIHPFGVGFNVGPTFMAMNGYGTEIHSLLTEILLDVGLPGLFMFILFIITSSIPLIISEKFDANMIGFAALVSLIYSFSTYNNFFYFQWVLWSLMCTRQQADFKVLI